MFEYDICFCTHKDCNRKDCRRHRKNSPVGIPVTVSDFPVSSYNDCEFYYPEDPFVKQCPKCGGKAVLKYDFLMELYGINCYWLECVKCGLKSKEFQSVYDLEEACKDWSEKTVR